MSLTICALFLALLVCVRSHLPIFSDSWYHLSVIRAFSERGTSFHAWWEYAPYGRPHLYSPLFHVANATVLGLTGTGLLDIAKFYGVVTFPLVLIAGWWAARCLFGQRPAFVTLLLLALNIGLVFPCSLIVMPATFALLLWPFVHLLLLRKRLLAAGLVLSLMAYLHFGLAAIAAVSLVVFALFRREFFRTALLVIAIAGVIFSPWLVHLYQHRAYLQSGVARLPVFIPLFTLLGALVGVVATVRKPEKEGLSVLSMILASGLFLLTLQERFWTYGGFLFAILGGYGIDRLARTSVRLVIAVLLISCFSVTPFLRPRTMKLAIPVPMQSTPFIIGTPFLTFFQWQKLEEASKIPAAVPADLAGLAQWICQNVDSNEILITENRLLGSSLFALTGRRTTSGLWSEVMTRELQERLAEYMQTAPGYIIFDRDRTDAAAFRGNVSVMAVFGKYAVLHRVPS